MSVGYNRPLYVLPFDHRHSYVSGMFHFAPPLTADQHAAVSASKWVIYDGFREALRNGMPRDVGAITQQRRLSSIATTQPGATS